MLRSFIVALAVSGTLGIETPDRKAAIYLRGLLGDAQAAAHHVDEAALKRLTQTDPRDVANWIALARLQDERGSNKDVERTLKAAILANDGDLTLLTTMCDFFLRTRQLRKALPVLEDLAKRHPSSALFYRSASLRIEGLTERNLRRRDELLAEAGRLKRQANEAQRKQTDPTPPLTLPPLPEDDPVDGRLPVRVGGTVRAPTKIRDMRPHYPMLAINAQVTGTVVLDAVIDTQGNVRSAAVVRSVPMLDAAAVQAVMGWKFQPPVVDGVAAPVVVSVTVNFSLQ